MSVNVASEQAREALRREHDVRVVAPEQEGLAAQDLPAGVFGFTGSAALASPLFASRRYRNFEVHRIAGGPAVIGFVTSADAAKLTTRSEHPATIRVFPDAELDATTIVSIPYDRIVQHRQYSVRNAEAITLQVSPAPSSTNR